MSANSCGLGASFPPGSTKSRSTTKRAPARKTAKTLQQSSSVSDLATGLLDLSALLLHGHTRATIAGNDGAHLRFVEQRSGATVRFVPLLPPSEQRTEHTLKLQLSGSRGAIQAARPLAESLVCTLLDTAGDPDGGPADERLAGWLGGIGWTKLLARELAPLVARGGKLGFEKLRAQLERSAPRLAVA